MTVFVVAVPVRFSDFGADLAELKEHFSKHAGAAREETLVASTLYRTNKIVLKSDMRQIYQASKT